MEKLLKCLSGHNIVKATEQENMYWQALFILHKHYLLLYNKNPSADKLSTEGFSYSVTVHSVHSNLILHPHDKSSHSPAVLL